MNFNGTNSEVQADVVSASGKKAGKGAAAAAVAAVIVGGAGISYAAVPAVRNSVKMAVMKPDKYVASVYEDLADKVDSAVNSSSLSENNSTDITYDITFDDKVMNELRTQLGSDMFSNLVLNMTMVSDGEREKCDFSLEADGRHVLSSDTVIDKETAYLNIHGLSDRYISVKQENKYTDMAASYMNTEKISDTVTKYDNMIPEFIGSGTSTLEKGVEGDAEGVHYKYNVVTTVLTPENIDAFTEDLAGKIEADENIDSSSEEISRIVEGLKAYDPAEGKGVTVASYIDPNGMLRGIDISIDGDEKDEPAFSAIAAKQNDHYVMKGSYEGVCLIFDGNENNGVHNGTVTVSEESADETLAIKYSDARVVKNSFVTGKFSCDLSDLTSNEIGQLELVFEEEDGCQKVSTNIADFGSIIMTTKTSKNDNVKIDVPSDSIDVENMSEYFEGTDLKKFITDVLEALGVDKDTAAQLSGYVSALAAPNSAENAGSDYSLFGF